MRALVSTFFDIESNSIIIKALKARLIDKIYSFWYIYYNKKILFLEKKRKYLILAHLYLAERVSTRQKRNLC